MKPIRSPSDLIERIDEDRIWRKRELATLKMMHDDSRSHQAIILRRSGVALLYAHWEGFVKSAGTLYLQFVASQRLKYGNLNTNFVALGLKSDLLEFESTNKGSRLVRIVESVFGSRERSAKLQYKNAIQTKSNLNSERFRDIIAILGFDYSVYESRENIIIDKLVDRRNSIAHGQMELVDSAEYDILHAETIYLMDLFNDQVVNSAVLQTYRNFTP